MAIQMRRGVYDKFDPSRMMPGEWAVVLSGAPDATNGMAAYVCFAPGQVKRVVTVEDMATVIANAEPELAAALTENVGKIAAAIQQAEARRVDAESRRVVAEGGRVTAEEGRAAAESARVSAETAREVAQTKNNADQAQNNAAAKGMTFHVCGPGEYAPDPNGAHNVPSVAGATGVMYLTPVLHGETAENKYDQWMHIDGAWELMGETGSHVDPVTTGDIDSIVSGSTVTGERYLNASGLSYLAYKLLSMLARKAHTHGASDISSGTLAATRGGTGVTSAAAERQRLGLGGTTGAVPVASGGTGATSAGGALSSLGAASSAELAELRSATLSDTGWVPVYASADGKYFVRYRAIGGVCYLMWDQTGVGQGGWYATSPIPKKYLPEAAMYLPSAVYGANSTGSVWVPARSDPGGKPWFVCYDASARIVGSASWPYAAAR